MVDKIMTSEAILGICIAAYILVAVVSFVFLVKWFYRDAPRDRFSPRSAVEMLMGVMSLFWPIFMPVLLFGAVCSVAARAIAGDHDK